MESKKEPLNQSVQEQSLSTIATRSHSQKMKKESSSAVLIAPKKKVKVSFETSSVSEDLQAFHEANELHQESEDSDEEFIPEEQDSDDSFDDSEDENDLITDDDHLSGDEVISGSNVIIPTGEKRKRARNEMDSDPVISATDKDLGHEDKGAPLPTPMADDSAFPPSSPTPLPTPKPRQQNTYLYGVMLPKFLGDPAYNTIPKIIAFSPRNVSQQQKREKAVSDFNLRQGVYAPNAVSPVQFPLPPLPKPSAKTGLAPSTTVAMEQIQLATAANPFPLHNHQPSSDARNLHVLPEWTDDCILCDASWQLIGCAAALGKPVKTIPNDMRPLILEATTRVLAQAITAPTDANFKKAALIWSILLIDPVKKRRSTMRERAQKIITNQPWTFTIGDFPGRGKHTPPPPKSTSSQPSDETKERLRLLRQVNELCESQNLSKAYRSVVNSTPPLTITPTILDELKRLNPPSDHKLLSHQELCDYEAEFDRIETFEAAENERIFTEVSQRRAAQAPEGTPLTDFGNKRGS